MAFLNEIGLERLWSHIVAKLGNKVDKVDGKVLSTNDYTTEDKNKLTSAVEDVNTLNTLVGDTSVAEQIAAANIIYIGPDAPTDSNIQVWINTAEEGTGVIPVLPRITTITLAAANWAGDAAPYSQIVNVNTVTSSTKIELNPTSAQIVDLQNEDISLMAENSEGVVTVYSFGGKPEADMFMQATLTEVSYV